MTRITTHGRDSWTGRNAEQNARLIRDMPIEPMQDAEPWTRRFERAAVKTAGVIGAVAVIAAFFGAIL